MISLQDSKQSLKRKAAVEMEKLKKQKNGLVKSSETPNDKILGKSGLRAKWLRAAPIVLQFLFGLLREEARSHLLPISIE